MLADQATPEGPQLGAHLVGLEHLEAGSRGRPGSGRSSRRRRRCGPRTMVARSRPRARRRSAGISARGLARARGGGGRWPGGRRPPRPPPRHQPGGIRRIGDRHRTGRWSGAARACGRRGTCASPRGTGRRPPGTRTVGVDEPVRLDEALALGVVGVEVGEAQPLGPATGQPGGDQLVEIRPRARPGRAARRSPRPAPRPARAGAPAAPGRAWPAPTGPPTRSPVAPPAAARRPMATATASSSSSTSGGRCPPRPSV